MIYTTIGVFERMWAWSVCFYFKIREISLLICLATPSILMMVFSLVRAIALDTPRALNMAWYGSMSSLLTILALGILRFILASWIVVINLPTLKHLLIRLLVLLLLWMSQMSIQIIDILDLGKTLMTHGFDTRTILLKIWFCLIIPSISLGVRCSLDELWG